MPDDMDRAQEINELFQSDILEAHQRGRSAVITSRTHCLDCGFEIPQARRAAIPGCRRCIDCQEILESFGGSVR